MPAPMKIMIRAQLNCHGALYIFQWYYFRMNNISLPSSQAMTTVQTEAPIAIVYAKSLWPMVTTACGAFTIVATTAFGFGHFWAESENSKKQLELNTSLQRTMNSLVAAQERIATLQGMNEKLIRDDALLRQQFSSQSDRMSKLNSQANADANCTFIREQIRKLEDELNSGLEVMSFALDNNRDKQAREQKEIDRRATIDQKIARYQAQLGPGACK